MEKCIVSEDICGDIQLKDTYCHKIWEGIGLSAFITIKIQNSSENIMDLILINEAHHYTEIYPNEVVILSMANMRCIKIKCKCIKNDMNCLGCFRMFIHYPIDSDSCTPKKTKYPYTNITVGRDGIHTNLLKSKCFTKIFNLWEVII